MGRRHIDRSSHATKTKRCNWCGQPSVGFYCEFHTKLRNSYERAKRHALKAKEAAFIMNARKDRS